jgi:Xaa-Pro aminopeptidase
MQKLSRLRKKFSDLKIDGILITDPVNVRYLSGFTGSSGFIIVSREWAVFATDFRYQEQVKQEIEGFDIWIEKTERTREIKKICDETGIKRLGFEAHHVTYQVFRALSRKRLKLKPVSDVVESLRIIKSPEEIAHVRTAVKRAEAAFKKLIPFIRKGATERSLALRLERLLKSEGCKSIPFDVIVASGPVSAMPHAKASDRKLQAGDLVIIDWGGESGGYYSDMTRTVLLNGDDLSHQRKIYRHVLEAQKRAISKVRSGVSAAKVDAAARDHIESLGYGDFFGHGTGHGVGLAIHERPVVSWRSKHRLKNGMIFTVEPGIYVPGFGGVRIEDMILIEGGKAKRLTSLPRRLNIIK